MELTLAMPRQRTTAPILAVSIILGLLLSPLLERALEPWMQVCAVGAPQQNSSNSETSGWELRAVWH